MARIAGVYAITDGKPDVVEHVETILRAGVHMVQYRDKSSDERKRLDEANELADLCSSYDALFIVNDDVMLAKRCGADGVHLGKDDATISHARDVLDDRIIGVSCYNDLQRAIQAREAGADYVAFGRFFSSATKPDAVEAPLALLSQAKKNLKIPIVAIGGINAANASQVIKAGADAIAVIDSIFAAGDIYEAAHELVNCFGLKSGPL